MPRPTLLQSLLQQPTTKYSTDYKYSSPATSIARRRGAASDAGSVYSLGDSDTDSLFAGSIRSSQSLGRPSKRRSSRRGNLYNSYASYSDQLNASPGGRQAETSYAPSNSSWMQESPRRRRRSIVSARDLEVGYQPPPKELPETPTETSTSKPDHDPLPTAASTSSSPRSREDLTPPEPSTLPESTSRSYLQYQSPSQTDLRPASTSPPPVPYVPPAHVGSVSTNNAIAPEPSHSQPPKQYEPDTPIPRQTSLQPEPAWSAPRPSKRLSLVAEEAEVPTPPAVERAPDVFTAPAAVNSAPKDTTKPVEASQPVEMSQPILSPLAPRPKDVIVLTSFELVLPSLHLTGKVTTDLPAVTITVRLTTDSWRTHQDAGTTVARLPTGGFSFRTASPVCKAGDMVQCAVRMNGENADLWDSDGGKNFSFLVPGSADSGAVEPVKTVSETSRPGSPTDSFRSATSNPVSQDPSDSAPSVQAVATERDSVAPLPDGLPQSSSVYSNASAPRIFLSRSESEAGGLQEVYPEGTPPAQRVLGKAITTPSIDEMPDPIRYAAPVARRPSPSAQLSGQTVPNLERNAQSQNATPMSRSTSASSSTVRYEGPGASANWPVGEAMSAPPLPDFSPPSNTSSSPSPIPFVKPTAPNGTGPFDSYAQGNGSVSPLHVHCNGTASPPPRSVSRTSSVGGRSSSRSVRPAFVKEEWTPETLGSNASTMCALAISRASSSSSPIDPNKGISLDPPASPTKRLFGRKPAANQPVKQWSAYKVAFTQHAQLPPKIKSGQVLVQVLATGIDLWDQARVRELARRSDGLGFVPGRSFYGKLLQVGADCKLHAGQFVYGLNELATSGALAELLVVDKSRITVAPACDLTAEQMAVLPVMGVPAAAAVVPIANELPKNARVFVLDAAGGAGSMVVQLFRALRPAQELYIAAQVPPSTLDAEALCERLGADDVFRDDVIEALSRINDSSFDVVIDCIGGKRVYEASRRILRAEGTFATLVGDLLGSGDEQKRAFSTSLKSLRSAFKRREHKRVNYWMPAMSETDPRDYLDVIREQVESKGLVPEISKVWRLEHAVEAFATQHRLLGSHVVRVVER